MHDFHIHWTTVIVGTAAYFVLGAFWYGVLAGPWLKAIGMTKAEAKSGEHGTIYGIQFVSTLLMVLLASYVLHDAFHVDEPVEGLLAGLILGVIASLASSGDFLYEQRRRSMPLFLINSGYRVVGMVVLGVIVGLLD